MAYLRHFIAITALTLLLLQGGALKSPTLAPQTSLRQTTEGDLMSKNVAPESEIIESINAAKLTTLALNLHPGSEHREDSTPTPQTSRHCRALAYQALLNLPAEHRQELQDLTLFYTEDGRRGLGGNGSIILRCLNVTDSEFIGVMTHEMGHIVDSNYLKGTDENAESSFKDFDIPVLADDASATFYAISWNDETTKKSDSNSLDFVSIYATTDPFEDFAETYAYYRLHGAEFRQLKNSSAMLREKYEFMKLEVFGGSEFGFEESDEDATQNFNIWLRNYDVTVLPFSLQSFMSS
ncbi:MAG: putative zinc-binding metallopeptidase [Patescibacteria group bacterium]